MRALVPYIFWPWFGISCFILLRRRVTGGSWKPAPADATEPEKAPITFPPLPREQTPTGSTLGDLPAPPPPDDGSVLTVPPPAPSAGAATLAEALEGIAMPCDLTPLMGAGGLDPRAVSFFTGSHTAAEVGSALADELERLGYEITPIDERTIKAGRDGTDVRARLVSQATDPEHVIAELHPSAPPGSVIAELKLA